MENFGGIILSLKRLGRRYRSDASAELPRNLGIQDCMNINDDASSAHEEETRCRSKAMK